MRYQLRTQIERIGAELLRIEALANLNETIDRLFEELERTGNARLLEELCPYFGTVWPSARALAGALAARGEELRGRRVLEIGCGLALPSLLAAKLGARVVATDFHPEVPAFLERNRRANGIERGLEYRRVDWARGFPELGGPFDWIVGSDVLYEAAHADRLAGVIEAYATPESRVLIADPARPYLQGFVDGMAARGFRHETEIVRIMEEPGDGDGARDIFLISLARGA